MVVTQIKLTVPIKTKSVLSTTNCKFANEREPILFYKVLNFCHFKSHVLLEIYSNYVYISKNWRNIYLNIYLATNIFGSPDDKSAQEW